MFSLAPKSERESTCDHHKRNVRLSVCHIFVSTIENDKIFQIFE